MLTHQFRMVGNITSQKLLKMSCKATRHSGVKVTDVFREETCKRYIETGRQGDRQTDSQPERQKFTK